MVIGLEKQFQYMKTTSQLGQLVEVFGVEQVKGQFIFIFMMEKIGFFKDNLKPVMEPKLMNLVRFYL